MFEKCVIASLQISDWVGIAQTCILFATGAIVFWYTLETREIRKETALQNELFRQELNVKASREQLEAEKEAQLAEPIFKPAGSNINGGEATFNFKNAGEPITDLKVAFYSPQEIKCRIYPEHVLPRDEQGWIKLVNLSKDSKRVFITIVYKNRLRQDRAQDFTLCFDGQPWLYGHQKL